MLISPAYAQSAGGGGGGFDIVALLPLLLIFVVFYFLLIRPQQKRMKEHRQMVEALRRGDRVVTGGGIVGHVTKVVSDSEVQVEIAEGVRVRVLKNTIQQVLSKSEPANTDTGDTKTGSGSGGSGQQHEEGDRADPAAKVKNAAGKLLGGNRGDDQTRSG